VLNTRLFCQTCQHFKLLRLGYARFKNNNAFICEECLLNKIKKEKKQN
tara:strand:+ start:1797 stop:1940 length:144 start_codon:yes stop_codon:yes gene_type:complete